MDSIKLQGLSNNYLYRYKGKGGTVNYDTKYEL